jgi:hypothetical protein
MPSKLNPDTGLFEDVPDSPTDNPSTGFEQPPVTVIPSTPKGPTTPVIPVIANKNHPAIHESSNDIPKTAPTSVANPKPHTLAASQQLYSEIAAIVKEYGGLESNIPVNHVYWQKLNEYRSMR